LPDGIWRSPTLIMNAQDCISKNERNCLLTVAILAFVFFSAAIGLEMFRTSYNVEPTFRFAADGVHFVPGGFNLLTLFICSALIQPRRFIVSTCLTIVYAGLFLVSLLLRIDGTGYLGSEGFYRSPLLELYHKTSIFDYASALTILILLGWQGSILFRIHRQSRLQINLP